MSNTENQLDRKHTNKYEVESDRFGLLGLRNVEVESEQSKADFTRLASNLVHSNTNSGT